MREDSGEARKIGTLRKVRNWNRRKVAEASVEAWALTYLRAWFPLPVSPAHQDAAKLLQSCMDDGGLGALAISRGFGKTTWTLAAVLRAVLSGRRKYVVLICATDKLAEKAVKKLKAELETNDLLDQDYPEATQPIRALERITRRALGQIWDDGTPTRIEWNAGGLTLPTAIRNRVPAPSSGAIFHAVGITGAVRGLSSAGPNGEILRPDVVILDDVQTRESAKSPTQTSDRESVICDDVLGLAGPTTAIAAAMLATPIYQNDLPSRFLDPDRHPEWQGRRVPMLMSMPSDMGLWEKYKELRQDGQRAGNGGAPANEFYAANQAAMDAGAIVTWPARMKPGEASGLQSAMNIWCDNPRGFKAEYQCEPEIESLAAGAKELSPSALMSRLSGVPHGEVPRDCPILTAGFDAGGSLHWYVVVAWTDGFGGSVVDYGCWPRQAREFFAANDARPTLKQMYGRTAHSEVVHDGMLDLTNAVLGRGYNHEQTGGEMRISRALVDSGFETDAIYSFVKRSTFANVLSPSKGIPRTTTARGVMEWQTRTGERKGWHWRMTKAERGRGQMIQFDPDAWKTVLHERLTMPLGNNKAISFWGHVSNDRQRHEMLAEHLASEYSDTVTLRGATFDKWFARPDRDNHLLDCMVMAAVAASVSGLTLSPTADGRPLMQPAVKKVSLKEMQAKRRAAKRELAGVR